MVSRVLGDTLQIMLGYVDPEEASKIYKSVYGSPLQPTADPAEDFQPALKGIQTSLKELAYLQRSLLAGQLSGHASNQESLRLLL